MKNRLVINNKKVSIETDVNYSAIELEYIGSFGLKSLLPSNYLIRKGFKKIIILKFNKTDIIEIDLFEFSGTCSIYNGRIIDKDLKIHKLLKTKRKSQIWRNLKVNIKSDKTKVVQNWDSLTTDYNLLTNTDSTNITKYLSRNRNRTSGEVKLEYKNRYLKKHIKDSNIGNLEGFYTKGRDYVYGSKKTPYIGYYNVDLTNKAIYSGVKNTHRRSWKVSLSFMTYDNLFHKSSNPNKFFTWTDPDNEDGTPEYVFDDSMASFFKLTFNGGLPFIFCPDKDADNPEFAICRLASKPVFNLSSYGYFDTTLDIVETY